jgi:hypothetical protein
VAPTISTVARAASTDDTVVAQVDGRPVWGSCVADQLQRGIATDRNRALAQCIDFELLAQAAEARGLASDRDVLEETRRALVSRLVAVGFEARYQRPDDLKDIVDRVVERNRPQMDKPELRQSAFVRVEVATTATPDEDARAKALAEQIHAALANETGLFPSHLTDTANRLATGTGLHITNNEFRAATREGVVKEYGDALFAISEVGRISPPTRTKWGWDIVLLLRVYPPRVYTRDEVAADVFPELRRQFFMRWVDDIMASLGVKIVVDQQQLAESMR